MFCVYSNSPSAWGVETGGVTRSEIGAGPGVGTWQLSTRSTYACALNARLAAGT